MTKNYLLEINDKKRKQTLYTIGDKDNICGSFLHPYRIKAYKRHYEIKKFNLMDFPVKEIKDAFIFAKREVEILKL